VGTHTKTKIVVMCMYNVCALFIKHYRKSEIMKTKTNCVEIE